MRSRQVLCAKGEGKEDVRVKVQSALDLGVGWFFYENGCRRGKGGRRAEPKTGREWREGGRGGGGVCGWAALFSPWM